jgi:hypothetical protein
MASIASPGHSNAWPTTMAAQIGLSIMLFPHLLLWADYGKQVVKIKTIRRTFTMNQFLLCFLALAVFLRLSLPISEHDRSRAIFQRSPKF